MDSAQPLNNPIPTACGDGRNRGAIRPGLAILALLLVSRAGVADEPARRAYENTLRPISNPQPLLTDQPRFVEPIRETARFEAPVLIDDEGADLDVRAWRFSYNARGIIEVPNRLRAEHTAVIVVHPWGIDDSLGWTSPEPAGVAFACTPEKNRLAREHMRQAIDPFLKSLRGRVGLVMYSLPGKEDPIRRKIYRSVRGQPTADDRRQGLKELSAKLHAFSYRGQSVASQLSVATDRPAIDYFRQFPGLDSSKKFNNDGFWDLPIPVADPIEVDLADVVMYDADGYDVLKKFLKEQKIRHVLLAGYHTDMCVCKTTAGYNNLRQDFDVFLVGDATQATFPANDNPKVATTAAVAFASLDLFITQSSWVHYRGNRQAAK